MYECCHLHAIWVIEWVWNHSCKSSISVTFNCTSNNTQLEHSRKLQILGHHWTFVLANSHLWQCKICIRKISLPLQGQEISQFSTTNLLLISDETCNGNWSYLLDGVAATHSGILDWVKRKAAWLINIKSLTNTHQPIVHRCVTSLCLLYYHYIVLYSSELTILMLPLFK